MADVANANLSYQEARLETLARAGPPADASGHAVWTYNAREAAGASGAAAPPPPAGAAPPRRAYRITWDEDDDEPAQPAGNTAAPPPEDLDMAATLEVTADPACLPGPPAELSAARGAQPWAIHPAALPLAVDLLTAAPVLAADPPPPAAAAGDDAYEPAVAVLRCDGVILPRLSAARARWYAGYAVGAENLAAAVEAAALSAPAVMVCFDSPGGSVANVPEAAARIAAVAARKPVVAVADHLAASAAYWLAAACSAVVCSPSAQVGSVGVILVRPSYARQLDDAGVDVSVFSRGKGKTDRMWYTALADDAAERLDGEVEEYYRGFASAVARGRGVPPRTVRDEWGATVLTAEPARAAGMSDLTATARAALAMLSTPKGRSRFRTIGAARSIVNNVSERE